MKAPNTYILSIINHKEQYQLTEDLTIKIEKSYENNLRERNPQLGRVEVVSDENQLRLSIGDVVAVNHFTFYGDIGKNREFILKDHVEYDGKRLFPALVSQIFFRYNEGFADPLGDFTLCNRVQEEQTKSGIYIEPKPHKNVAEIAYGDDAGTKVLVFDNSLYLITLDRVEYFKIRKDEIVATIVDGVVMPTKDNVLVEYIPEAVHPFLDLSFVKKPNNLTARVLMSALDGVNAGDIVRVFRNQGIEYNGKRVIHEDSILFLENEEA